MIQTHIMDDRFFNEVVVRDEVNKLRARVQQLEGSDAIHEPLSASLQRIMEDIDFQI